MFFRNYSVPGKGVNKRDSNQPRYQIYFDILPRYLWRIIKLNMLYILTAFPLFLITTVAMQIVSSQISLFFIARLPENVVADIFPGFGIFTNIVLACWFTIFCGQGPVTAGLTYIVREYGSEKPCWMISEFFETIKSNFKQGIVLWILDLVIVRVGLFSIIFYINRGIYFVSTIIFFVLSIWLLAHIYMYQIMITFDLKFKNVVKNAVLIALIKLPQSIVMGLSLIVIFILLPYAALFYGNGLLFAFVTILGIFFMPAFSSFTINFCVFPTLKKYIADV